MRHVVITGAGSARNLGDPSQVLSGLTLESVGRGTVIDNLQVSQSGHHGIDVRGGRVNLRNVIVSNVYDGDSLRLDAGYQGNIQYALVKQHDAIGDDLNHRYARSVRRWVLAPEPYSWGAGPDEFNKDWWSADESILESRGCLYDDEYIFGPDGSFRVDHNGDTYREVWQGVDNDECGDPVPPHDGSTLGAWSHDHETGRLTLKGRGTYVVLPKAVNGLELASNSEVPEERTYRVYPQDDGSVVLTIQAGYDWPIWWSFKLVRSSEASVMRRTKPTLANVTVIADKRENTNREMLSVGAGSGAFLHNFVTTVSPSTQTPIDACIRIDLESEGLIPDELMVNEWLQHCGNDEFGMLAVNSRGEEIFSLDNGTVVKTEPELRMTLAAGSTAAMLSQPNDWVTFNDQNLGSSADTDFLEATDFAGAVDPVLSDSSQPWWSGWSIEGRLGGAHFQEIIVGYITVFGTAG